MSNGQNHAMSPSKEKLLVQYLTTLERSPSTEESKYGSQCSINMDNRLIDLPTEPKRRRMMADDTPSSMGSQVSSQMSSRSHSPSLSESLMDDSLVSTPSMSPTGTLKEHFRRKYRKDELWAAIETNYKYLMDKGIIEACQTNESDLDSLNSAVSFQEFLQHYKELTDWLKTIQSAVNQKKASRLALSEKYLNQSYYEEIQRSPRMNFLSDYAHQLKQRQPILKEEIDVFLHEVTTQWQAVEKALAPAYQYLDHTSMRRDLEDDLDLLKKWLDGVEEHLRQQTTQDWPFQELEGVLLEHKVLQQDIESHSRIVSAVLKLSERLHDSQDDLDLPARTAHNIERRWHEVWLQSLEWQCRLEDAISKKKGIFNSSLYLNPHQFDSQKDYTDDDYDSQDVTSCGEDSFIGLDFRSCDFIHSPPTLDSSANLSLDCDKSSGKDSAVASETEQKTCSDMSENYQDLSVSTSSDSDREFLRQNKIKKHDSRDIGYGSESQSDELEMRYPGITFSGINGRLRKTSTKCGNFYATVAVDTESTDKSDVPKSSASSHHAGDQTTCEDSDINLQIEQVLLQEEMGKEDIRYLIDQADIMVQQGNTFNRTYSPKRTVESQGDLQNNVEAGPEFSNSSAPVQREMMDKGVGTVESSCDASDEESCESDAPAEEHSMITDDGTETFDSVVGSEYTSDEMKNGVRDYSRLPKLYDTNSLRLRTKGRSKDRPWSVVEVRNIGDIGTISASEGAIDKLGTLSDSELPSCSMSQSVSPTFPRRARRHPANHRPITNPSTSVRSQLGAKRKLDLEKSLSPQSSSCNTTINVTINSEPGQRVVSGLVHSSISEISEVVNSDVSGHTPNVPLGESCTSDDEPMTPMDRGDLMSTLQSARFKSSGSSYDDSDTQGEVVMASEAEDPGSFSENAWDNYQAPLYPTGSEDPPEEALTWEPGEMEFDDEFSLPQSTILATLISRRSEEEPLSNKHAKLVPSAKGNYEDSDSDIEDLHHVLEESRMQLKVADRSLRKKRKDPLKTGLYINPGKYGELMATIETNIRCLETINQHLDTVDISPADRQTIQDLMYQWEKLRALASDRRNQSQEVETMYATFLSIETVAMEGIPLLERSKFKDIEELCNTVIDIQNNQKFVMSQLQICQDLHQAAMTFSTHNPSVNMECFLNKISETEAKLADLLKRCNDRLPELCGNEQVWHKYNTQKIELEALLSQEHNIIAMLLSTQESQLDRNHEKVDTSLKRLVANLSLYDDKLMSLQQLRSQILLFSEEDGTDSMSSSLSEIRCQLYEAQRQCREVMLLERQAQRHALQEQAYQAQPAVVEKMDAETTTAVYAKPQPLRSPHPKPRPSSHVTSEGSSIISWLKYFPLQAIALAVLLGLIYLAAPDALHRLLDFTMRISPELEYVNGAPPM